MNPPVKYKLYKEVKSTLDLVSGDPWLCCSVSGGEGDRLTADSPHVFVRKLQPRPVQSPLSPLAEA